MIRGGGNTAALTLYTFNKYSCTCLGGKSLPQDNHHTLLPGTGNATEIELALHFFPKSL